MMTEQELTAARAAIRKLPPYRPGPRYANPDSFPTYVADELGLKIASTFDNLILVIKALDRRLTDLEQS